MKTLSGCDSTITLNLRVIDPSLHAGSCEEITITDAVCQNEMYNDFGFTLPKQTAAGTFKYKRILQSQSACDSLVQLNLTVHKVYDKLVKLEIKDGNPVVIDGNLYSEPETVIKSDKSIFGCDSLTTYMIVREGDESSNGKGEWSDCDPIVPDKWFSPNGDTVNDLWQIENIECYNYQIEIYDRYGKRLRLWTNNFEGWDGIYNGNPVISDDYWYIIDLKGINQKAFVGHFNLRR